MNSKLSILYQNLKAENTERLLLSILQIVRRLVYGINMILFHPSPYIQVVINSSFSCSLCYFIILNQPFKKKLDNIMNIYIEFITFCTFSILGAFIYEELHSYLYNIAEWSLIILIYLSIMGPALLSIIISCKDFVICLRRINEGENRV